MGEDHGGARYWEADRRRVAEERRLIPWIKRWSSPSTQSPFFKAYAETVLTSSSVSNFPWLAPLASWIRLQTTRSERRRKGSPCPPRCICDAVPLRTNIFRAWFPDASNARPLGRLQGLVGESHISPLPKAIWNSCWQERWCRVEGHREAVGGEKTVMSSKKRNRALVVACDVLWVGQEAQVFNLPYWNSPHAEGKTINGTSQKFLLLRSWLSSMELRPVT